MFGGELVFVLLLAIPMLTAVILLKITCADEPQPTGSVMPTYWGTYDGASKVARPEFGRIKLQDPVQDTNPAPAQQSVAALH